MMNERKEEGRYTEGREYVRVKECMVNERKEEGR